MDFKIIMVKKTKDELREEHIQRQGITQDVG